MSHALLVAGVEANKIFKYSTELEFGTKEFRGVKEQFQVETSYINFGNKKFDKDSKLYNELNILNLYGYGNYEGDNIIGLKILSTEKSKNDYEQLPMEMSFIAKPFQEAKKLLHDNFGIDKDEVKIFLVENMND